MPLDEALIKTAGVVALYSGIKEIDIMLRLHDSTKRETIDPSKSLLIFKYGFRKCCYVWSKRALVNPSIPPALHQMTRLDAFRPPLGFKML